MADKWFKLVMPNGYKKTLFYNPNTNKNNLLQEQVLDYWEDYAYDHWIWLKAFNPFKYNYEDITKALLDRCGTFLLLGNFKNGMVITPDKEKVIKKLEIPLSCASTDIQNLVSEVDSDLEYSGASNNSNTILSNEIILNNANDPCKKKPYKKNKIKKYTDIMSKINKLYKSNDITTIEIYKLKNKDLYDETPKDIMLEEDKKKWLNKNAKNLHGENIFDYKKKLYKGNSIGHVDRSRPYLSRWCYVWSDNTFNFNGRDYKIDNIKQYEILGDNIAYMDSILCLEQDNKVYFYDMNIDEITCHVRLV